MSAPGFSRAARRATLAAVLVAALSAASWAQTDEDFHLFPYVADGGTASGIAYRTLFIVVALEGTASCTLGLEGLGPERIDVTAFEDRGIGFLFTHGTAPELEVGYATLSCTAAVIPFATVHEWDPAREDDDVLAMFRGIEAMATFEPAAPASAVDVRGTGMAECECRVAIAVANDGLTDQTYRISWEGAEATRTVAPKTTDAFFIDELHPGSAAAGPFAIRILDAAGGFFASDRLYVTALQFVGGRFSPLPASVRR